MARRSQNLSKSPAMPRKPARRPTYPMLCASVLLSVSCGGHVGERMDDEGTHHREDGSTGGQVAGGLPNPYEETGGYGAVGSGGAGGASEEVAFGGTAQIGGGVAYPYETAGAGGNLAGAGGNTAGGGGEANPDPIPSGVAPPSYGGESSGDDEGF